MVIAPKSCPTEWCTDTFAADLAASIRDTKGLNKILEYADYSRTAVVGQSMGGNAALKLASWNIT